MAKDFEFRVKNDGSIFYPFFTASSRIICTTEDVRDFDFDYALLPPDETIFQEGFSKTCEMIDKCLKRKTKE